MTKQGIRGFALGMILTTIVMMTVISFSTEKQAENPVSEIKPRTETEKKTPITKELIKTYLDENNSVILSEEEYNDLLAENIIKTNKEEEIIPEDPTEANNEGIEKSPDNSTKDLSLQNSSEITEVIHYTLIVKSGMNSEEVTNLLFINGIIDSKENFKKYLDDHNLNEYIQIGNFQVNNTMSYEQLGKIITK